MKHTLKKKTKISDIIFPRTFQKEQIHQCLPHQTQIKEQSVQTANYHHHKMLLHRNLNKQSASKARSLSSQQRQLKRSYSQQSSKQQPNIQPPSQHNYLKKFTLKPKQQSKLQKKSKVISPAAELSRLFYKQMQTNLAKECDMAFKSQIQKRSFSTVKMTHVASNLFKIQRTIDSHPDSIIINLNTDPIIPVPSQHFLQSRPISKQSVLGHPQLQMIRISQDDKLAQSQVDIGYSQEDSEERSVIHESIVLRKISLVMDRKIQISGEPLISSSNRDCKFIMLIASKKTEMVSSKLLVRSSGFFRVCKIEFASKDMNQLLIFLQFCGQMVYKKISSLQEKKILDVRSRKNHLKKLHHLKDKLREKLFLHFTKTDQGKEVTSFFQDLLSLIEQCLTLEHSYLGLVLADYEEMSFSLINQQKLQYFFKGKQSFYFMMKLRGTYYLVKADSGTDLQAKFTLLIDFTSLSSGDQLVFPHNTPISHYSLTQSKIYRLLPKVAEDFILNASRQWGTSTQDSNQELCSAKVGKVLVQNLQKWTGSEVEELWGKLWDINNMYKLTEQGNNFFQFHTQFDYLFFTKPSRYFRVDDYNYSLHQSCTISLYKYPNHYEYIKTSQMQMEAIVIPHLPMVHNQMRRHVMTSFFARREANKSTETRSTFKILIKHFKIELKVKENIQMYLQSFKNGKCYKLVLPLEKPSKVKKLNGSQLSSYVQRQLTGYKIKVGLIYSKLTKNPAQNVVVYYKGLYKFQAQFVYVSLYKIVNLNMVEFKVHTFKMARNFIIRLQNAEFTQETLKETVVTLINYLKTVYFKCLLNEDARKSKKRRKDALQDFLKNQVKANPNNLRAKRKGQDQKRRKMMRIASIKWSQSQNLVYEEIVARACQTKKGSQCYFTLRYLPVGQLELAKPSNEQLVQLRVHVAGKLAIFKYQIAVKEVINIVDDKGKFEVTSLKELYLIFKEAEDKIRSIIQNSSQTLDFLFFKLKKFIDPHYCKKEYSVHPFKFKIIGNSFYQTKVRNHEEKVLSTQLSIDLNLQKRSSIATESLFQTYIEREFMEDMQLGSKISQKSVCRPFYTLVTEKWVVEVVDITNQQDEWTLMAESKRIQREIRIINRQTNRMYLLTEWEGCFLNGFSYHQFNKKMLKRVIAAIKISL